MGETYYIRAYVINAGVTHYGAEQTLDFSAVLPTVTIQDATNVVIGSSVSATLNGTITSLGDPAYTERGFVYGTMSIPTIYDATVATVAGTVTGSFSTQVSNLPFGSCYVRAYAKNAAGQCAYSEVINIETAKLCVSCGPGGSNLWVALVNTTTGSYAWGPTNINTNATSTNDGFANMNTIKSIDASLNSYPAFKACNDIGDGWYLPSKNELTALYENRNTLGGFTPGGYSSTIVYLHWSSTEVDSENALSKVMANGSSQAPTGSNLNAPKTYSRFVRCVKRVE